MTICHGFNFFEKYKWNWLVVVPKLVIFLKNHDRAYAVPATIHIMNNHESQSKRSAMCHLLYEFIVDLTVIYLLSNC